jgi:hypothetical protein
MRVDRSGRIASASCAKAIDEGSCSIRCSRSVMRGASATTDIVADYCADEAGLRIRVGTASPGIL